MLCAFALPLTLAVRSIPLGKGGQHH
jgi:hypothetical protein